MAYLWYFDKPTEIGFEWTGSSHDPIEVTHGGFGEPIGNVFYTTPTGVNLTEYFKSLPTGKGPIGVVTAFEILCQAWVQVISADIHGQEPMAVINSGDVVRDG